MACDMCGKTGTELEFLTEALKTDEIQQICSDCKVAVNKHLDKVRRLNRSFLDNTLKRFMMVFKRDRGGR